MSSDEIADLRALVDRSIEENEHGQALALLERLWRRKPGASTAAFVNSRVARIEGFEPRVRARVAIIRSFTVEPVVPLARAEALVHQVDLTFDVGGFNTYAQDLLDPGGFVTTGAYDVVIIAVQTRDIAPELWEFDGAADPSDLTAVSERVIGEFSAMIRAFRSRADAHVVIHGLEAPAHPALGLADERVALGQVSAVDHINRALAALADELPGVHVLAYERLIAHHGRSAWHDEDKWATMRMPLRADSMTALAHEWLRFVFPIVGRVAKVLVVDLDNTLWGGVVGEDGVENIEIGPTGSGAGYRSLQQSLLDISSRGILLGICSKNNHADALEALEQHPEMRLRPHHFSAMRVNWQDKATNLREIATELNIGLDSVAFLDDNPAECELVRRELPEVTVIELDRPPAVGGHPLVAHPIFERLNLSAEDLRRGVMYAQQRERKDLESQSGSLEDYLHSLATRVSVMAVAEADIARVAQLTQKTNQFNLTTRRYSEQQIAAMVDDPATEVFAARAADRFGDHGLVGVAITRRHASEWELDTFLLSCRVIGRGVETAMLAAVADAAGRVGVDTMLGSFVPTPKNEPAARFLPTHGFETDGATPTQWTLSLSSRRPVPPAWISMTTTQETTDE